MTKANFEKLRTKHNYLQNLRYSIDFLGKNILKTCGLAINSYHQQVKNPISKLESNNQ